jgi:hypothetical protein
MPTANQDPEEPAGILESAVLLCRTFGDDLDPPVIRPALYTAIVCDRTNVADSVRLNPGRWVPA